MNQFVSVADAGNMSALIAQALDYKQNPLQDIGLGIGRTLGLMFFNPSLRTRLSSQRAAQNLGMQVLMMNLDKEGWAVETRPNAIMDGDKSEHIAEAAGVIGRYVDILGVRAFAGLQDCMTDYQEPVLAQFEKYARKPLLSLESATRHPLQSLADMITIEEQLLKNPLANGRKPKVVLTWAPHPKALPQAVPNSFAEWALAAGHDLHIACPAGYDLHPDFSRNATLWQDQDKALENADFVYVKNWSSYMHYGQILCQDPRWQFTEQKLALTSDAKVMHCLPVRRNVVLSDQVLDGPNSIVLDQAENRIYACQAVLAAIIRNL